MSKVLKGFYEESIRLLGVEAHWTWRLHPASFNGSRFKADFEPGSGLEAYSMSADLLV